VEMKGISNLSRKLGNRKPDAHRGGADAHRGGADADARNGGAEARIGLEDADAEHRSLWARETLLSVDGHDCHDGGGNGRAHIKSCPELGVEV
jgi:hypothetical protein